jgi:hypothetical protein
MLVSGRALLSATAMAARMYRMRLLPNDPTTATEVQRELVAGRAEITGIALARPCPPAGLFCGRLQLLAILSPQIFALRRVCD